MCVLYFNSYHLLNDRCDFFTSRFSFWLFFVGSTCFRAIKMMTSGWLIWVAGWLVGLAGLPDGMIDWLVQWFMVRLTIFEEGFNFVVKWKFIVTVEVSGNSSIALGMIIILLELNPIESHEDRGSGTSHFRVRN